MKKMILLSLFCYFALFNGLFAQSGLEPDPAENPVRVINEWLVAGPMPIQAPVFAEKNTEERLSAALKHAYLDPRSSWPEAGQTMPWPLSEQPLEWRKAANLEASPGKNDRVAYLAGYLETKRYQPVTLTLKTKQHAALFVDGMQEKTLNPATGEASITLDLTRGKHRILIKTVSAGEGDENGWTLTASLEPADTMEWTLDPRRTFTHLEDRLALKSFSTPALSPDGKRLAVQISANEGPERKRATWIEILDSASGQVLGTIRMGSASHTPRWAPNSQCLAFRSGRSLWTFFPEEKRFHPVLVNEKGLGRYFWSPDSRGIYFMTTGDSPSQGDYTRVMDPRDRLTDWDETAQLNLVTADGSSRQALTALGSFAFTQAEISPDGGRLALVRRLAIPERPFFVSEFHLLNLSSGQLDLIESVRFPFENGPANLTWSPDGKRLAFTAPPGEVLAPGEGEEHNAFDTCLYLLDLEKGSHSRLSDRFGESVADGGLQWRARDNRIYFVAQNRAFCRIARLDPDADNGLEFLTQSPSVVNGFSLAADGDSLAYTGTSIDHPVRLTVMDLNKGTPTLTLDPNAAFMKKVSLGNWERFDFDNARGDTINGWLFYPPDFDANQTYPLVVYFYGGVSPQVERFSILYYHWLVANGYMLYVVNPAGAVGWSREFADAHVNDWGERAGRDILDGVQEVLARKPFLDASRIGCYGGSYGGFMTMSLITKSDLFKAACSMYGISNLTSYWGGGIWGYTYGDTAMAGSYPWTRPDIFVDRSPIFKADRIEAALLLLHGEADGNVPALESEQIFTALKVLNKEVAYVRFKGEDHGIGGKASNLEAHRRMILEWFDLHLKDQPEAWNDRWK